MASYRPRQGDIVYLDFSPQTGHEQAGRRPALVVSNDAFFAHTHLAVVCPITNTRSGFPLHIPLDGRTATTGVIQCEQCKSLDITARNASYIESLPQDLLGTVLSDIKMFF
jgi:mRNA interferase MazF